MDFFRCLYPTAAAGPASIFGLASNVLPLLKERVFQDPQSLTETREAVHDFVTSILTNIDTVVEGHLGTSKRSQATRLREFHYDLFHGMHIEDWGLTGNFRTASLKGSTPTEYFHELALLLGCAFLGFQEFPERPLQEAAETHVWFDKILSHERFLSVFGDEAEFVCREAYAIDPNRGLITLHTALPLLSGLVYTGSDWEDCFYHLIHLVWLHQMENYWGVPSLTLGIDPVEIPLIAATKPLNLQKTRANLHRALLGEYRSHDLYELGLFLKRYFAVGSPPEDERALTKEIRKRFQWYQTFLQRDDRFLSHAFLETIFVRIPEVSLKARRLQNSKLYELLVRLVAFMEYAAKESEKQTELEKRVIQWAMHVWESDRTYELAKSRPEHVVAKLEDTVNTLERRLAQLQESDSLAAVFDTTELGFQIA